MATPEMKYLTEVPSSLKQLTRLVARIFYSIEDALIVDMLVRNLCMREDDMVELLRFEEKQLRSRIYKLRNDKFIQTRLKIETSPDRKTRKVNYYFINYKSFVNVVKYKLDIMKSKETRCIDQLEPLYKLLREIEGIKLPLEILEPDPVDINTIRGVTKSSQRIDNQHWSGETTGRKGFTVEDSKIDRNLGKDLVEKKSRPVWMTESTIRNESNVDLNIADTVTNDSSQSSVLQTTSSGTSSNRNKNETEDIMSLLLLHEIQPEDQFSKNLKIVSSDHNLSDSDESDDDRSVENTDIPDIDQNFIDSNSEDDMPSVLVGGKSYPINEINEELIAQMTEQEKEKYIYVYQEQFSDICY